MGDPVVVKDKPCRICGGEIPVQAIKCLQCDSWQGWRGKIGANATVISMLTALVATTTAAVPVLIAATRIPDSMIYGTYSGTSLEGFNLIVVNSGDRPGVITGGEVIMPRENAQENLLVHLKIPNTDSSAIAIKPGEARDLVFAVTGEIEGKRDFAWLAKHDCQGSMDVIHFSGKKDKFTFLVPCHVIDGAAKELPSAGELLKAMKDAFPQESAKTE